MLGYRLREEHREAPGDRGASRAFGARHWHSPNTGSGSTPSRRVSWPRRSPRAGPSAPQTWSTTGATPPAGHLEDLTDAYRYLASEGADYVTGETLWVDGGTRI
ncbi:hypothetical protein I7X12_07140 [Halosimplex litoreum]|uniref:SDR family oxidoreductase n=1 Tax=Halosimplex litoreum TaxID=1198301 RepID=A0A7T3KWX5_9EURY|nr:hypothetical protein [Halosimplex litoreum]QPV64380.1 hypothetical protein I7X12_07140 [Halosimplex litoreum]